MPKTDRVDVTWTLRGTVSVQELLAIDALIATLLSKKIIFLRRGSRIDVERNSEVDLPPPPRSEELCARSLLMMCSPIQVFFDRWQVLFPRGDGKQTGFRKIHRMVHRYTIRFVGDLLLLSDEQLTIMKNIGAETLKKMSIVLSDFSLCRGPSRTLEAFATWRGLLTASENH